MWLLRTHLLHLQRWLSNTLFVWVDMVAAFSLSFSLSLTPSFSLPLFPFVPVKCYLLFPNKADRRKLWCKGTSSPSYCWVRVCAFVCLCVCLKRRLCCLSIHENIHFHKSSVRKCVFMYVCECEVCTMYSLCASFMIQRSSVRFGRMNQVARQLNVWQ